MVNLSNKAGTGIRSTHGGIDALYTSLANSDSTALGCASGQGNNSAIFVAPVDNLVKASLPSVVKYMSA